MAYYVFDDAKNLFEGMTKEEIVNAIASATGVDPSEISGDVITTALQERNVQKSIKLWVGTQNEYNAIATPDENTLYIVTDPHETNELQSQVDQLQARVDGLVAANTTNASGVKIEQQTASVERDSTSHNLRHTFIIPANATILELAYRSNQVLAAAWEFENIGFQRIPDTNVILEVQNYSTSESATFKIVYSYPDDIELDELTDIRVGYDGTEFESAGQAVRAQVVRTRFNDYTKEALLNLLRHVVYNDENGQQYFDELEAAMYMEAGIESITAVFEQGQNVIYDTDSLEDLRQYLTVTANLEDTTSIEVTTYTLSGTLTAGSSTITVTYGGKTTTFTANITSYKDRMSYSMTSGLITKLIGTFGSDSTHGYYMGSSNQNRRMFVFDYGETKLKTTTNGTTFTDSDYYPIPIPDNATRVAVAITPNTQFPSVIELVKQNGIYVQTANTGWVTGSANVTLQTGTNRYLLVNSKYNSAGTSYPTEPTELTVVFS